MFVASDPPEEFGRFHTTLATVVEVVDVMENGQAVYRVETPFDGYLIASDHELTRLSDAKLVDVVCICRTYPAGHVDVLHVPSRTAYRAANIHGSGGVPSTANLARKWLRYLHNNDPDCLTTIYTLHTAGGCGVVKYPAHELAILPAGVP